MTALIAFNCVAVACALLSLVVVTRRWAFIGEGIGHSGFGGAGTAWLLMALFPSLNSLEWLPYAGVVIFALGAGLGMGVLSRRGQISGDVAVGIFLVATVAWGFLGQRFYIQHLNVEPVGFTTFFFGQPRGISPQYALAAAAIATAVVMTLALLRKEILAYCVDPQLAEIGGVKAGLIHYLLIALISVTTIVGMQVVGTLLITALLVLPGATAQLLSKRLNTVTAISVFVGVTGALGGYGVSQRWPGVPTGPAIVLLLFALFVMAAIASKVRRA